jgi:putative intracellular protease/amidase
MPKVLILTGDAAEALEVIYPYQRLREDGYEVVIAALSQKSGVPVRTSNSDPLFTRSAGMRRIKSSS